ncbi:hypothetical protein DB346_24755 [Verrucomicrobia bacterium LW23]|nr:hypothetical protein DB346_24755 [Verrucomicrobia bacterium LW23]
MKRFYYADATNKPRGPVNFEELKMLAAAGTIRENTNVFPEGAKAWIKWGEVLKAEAPPAPAPAPALPPALSVEPAPEPVRAAAPTLVTSTSAVSPAPSSDVAEVVKPAASTAYAPAASAYNPAAQQPVAYVAPEPQPAQAYTPPATQTSPVAPVTSSAPTTSAPLQSAAPVRIGPPMLPVSKPAPTPEPEVVVEPEPVVAPASAEPEPVIHVEDASGATTTQAGSPAMAWLESPAEAAPAAAQTSWPPVEQAQPVVEPSLERAAPPSLTSTGETSQTRRGPRMRRETRDTLSGTVSGALTSSGQDRAAAKAREQQKRKALPVTFGSIVWGFLLVIGQCFMLPWTLIYNSAITLGEWGRAGELPTKDSEFKALTFLLVVIRPGIHLIFTILGILGSIGYAGFMVMLLMNSNMLSAIATGVGALLGGIISVYFLNVYVALIFESGALILSIYNSLSSIDKKTEDRAASSE